MENVVQQRQSRLLLLLLPPSPAPTSEENYGEFGADFEPASEVGDADDDVISCVQDGSDGRESITAESCTAEDRSVYYGHDDDDDDDDDDGDVETVDGWDRRSGPERAAVIESDGEEEYEEERRREDRAFWETCLASGYP